MGYWSFIQPEATINYIRNPSFEENITDGWANYTTGAAGGNRSYSSDDQMFGAWCLELEKLAGAQADRFGSSTTLTPTSVLNEEYIASTWVNIPNAATFTLTINKQAGVGAQQLISVDLVGPTSGWVRVETPVLTANATGDNIVVLVWITGTPNVSAYVDAVQFEIKGHTTTYCDGDQDGCEWLAVTHNGHSQRSAVSRAGGILVDFADRDFDIEGMIGAGMSPIMLNVDSYAILPGGELNSQKTNVRPFSLTGWVKGTSLSDLHAKRQQLIEDVAPNTVPVDQPIVIRYTGAAVNKEIEAYYETGLEGRIRGDFPCLEQSFALRFLATDPNFYEIGESAATPTSLVTATRRNVAARLKDETATSKWSVLGPPNVAGTYTEIYDILVASDKTVYWSGNFLNFDNIAAADHLVQYTPNTETWAVVGGGLGAGAAVMWGLAEGPTGDIYVCGQAQNIGGVANADWIAYWDGAAWNAVGVPNQAATVCAYIAQMAFDSTGNLYVVGNFTDLASAVASNLDYIAVWNGAAWAAVGNPTAGAAAVTAIFDVAIDSQDRVWVVGNFTTFANVAGADHIAMWDGAAWNAVTQLNAQATDIVINARDEVFFTGNFTTADGGATTVNYVARYDGQATTPLSTGFNGVGNNLAFGPDEMLYACGAFTTAGGVPVNTIAKWNGASWAQVDFREVATNAVTAITAGPADPVIEQNYDLWIGFATTGILMLRAWRETITNEGTEDAYPRINIIGLNAVSSIVYEIRNETTGKELLFAYTLLQDEELTIDLAPTRKSIVSSFFGRRQSAILPNCDFGTWCLQPGDNDISILVYDSAATGSDIEIIWSDPYWSAD